MSTNRIWLFFKENIISLVSVLIGIIVLILQGVGLITSQTVADTTLALVALLATSEIVERQGRLSKIEQLIQEQRKDISTSIDKIMVKELSADDCHEYMRFLFLSSKKSILWASPEPRRSSPSDTKRPYEASVDHILKQGKIRFTWISCFHGKARIERATKIFSKYSRNPRVFVGYIPEQASSISFVIFDETTLVTRLLFSQGGTSDYLVITSPSIVRLFISHFQKLLEQARKLDTIESIHLLSDIK